MIHHIQRHISSVRAFTLIEILVSVTILLVLFGGAIAGYSGFGQRQKVKQGGENVKNFIRTVQGRAYTGKKVVCVTPGYSLYGWQVNVSDKTYQEVCTNALGTPIPMGAVGSIVISPAVTISATNTDILFRTLPQGVDISSSYSFCVTDGTTEFEIIIDPSGNISDTPDCS